MVTLRYQLRLTATALFAMALLCQCKTVRTEGEIRRGGIKFDEAAWGGQGGGTDTGEIRSKFAERGYSLDENGKIVADRSDLYSNQNARGVSGSVDKKQAKFSPNNRSPRKQFQTPEYLKRQEFTSNTQSRYGNQSAREGNFGQSRDRQAGKLFNRNPSSSTQLSPFETTAFSGGNSSYNTTRSNSVTRSTQKSLDAQGANYKAGYQDGALSMDDVKKLVNPSSYARSKKL